MLNPAEWPKILLTYGPYAVLILLIFVVEPRIRAEKREHKDDVSVRRIHAAVWAAIFVFCGVVAWIWIFSSFASRETIIYGKLQGLPEQDIVLVSSKNLYLKRDSIDEATRLYDYSFRVPDSETALFFGLEHKDQTAAYYSLPTDAAFSDPKHPVMLTYHADKSISLDSPVPPAPKTYPPIPVMEAVAWPERPPVTGWFAGMFQTLTVHAAKAQAPSPATLDRLDSLDPIVRLDAVHLLAQAGSAAAPYVASVLYDPGSSTRQLLGALDSLNSSPTLASDMFGSLAGGLSRRFDSAQCTILQLADGPPGPLQTDAAAYLAKHPGVRNEKSCTPVRKSPLTCRGNRIVRLDSSNGIQRVTVESQHAYVLQTKLTTTNVATVYIIASEAEWPVDKLSEGTRNALLAKLQEVKITIGPAKLLILSMESFYVKQVKNGDAISVLLPNGHDLGVFVQETKFTNSRTDFQACTL